MSKCFNSVISFLLFFMLTVILALVLFAKNIDYYCKLQFLLPSVTIFFMILGLVIIFAVLFYMFEQKVHKKSLLSKDFEIDRIIAIFTLLLFAGQCYVFHNIFFLSGWDVNYVRNTAQIIASGVPVTGDNAYYFSIYPNNLLVTFLNAVVIRLNSCIGIFAGEYETMCTTVFCCLLNSSACYLTYKTTKSLTSRNVALIAYFLSVLSFGFSPWTVICYSDSVGIIFPILTFYFYVESSYSEKNFCIKKFLAIFTAILGYFVKPQCAIVLIAIIIYEIVKTFDKFEMKKITKPLFSIIMCVVLYLSVSIAIVGVASKLGIEHNNERPFSFAHFFMMGLNEERNGGYLQEDVEFSRSFEFAHERFDANMTKAFERINDMGVVGITKHISKKLLSAFNDGTFAWGMEGSFYIVIPKALNNTVSPFLRSIFYTEGIYNDYFKLFAQMIWLAILLLMTFSTFHKETIKNTNTVLVVKLVILGIVAWEILFEVRARYLYTCLPFFCILAGIGFQELHRFISKIKSSI